MVLRYLLSQHDHINMTRSINQYVLGKKIGQGSFAEVFLAKSDCQDGPFVAKRFNKSLLRRNKTMGRTRNGIVVHCELEKANVLFAAGL
jgi:recombinational DNA repair protein RecR